MTRRKGRIFVISSPSGGGKTTICNSLKKERFDIKYSISATTRRRRSGEVSGGDYYFLQKDKFRRLIRRKRFLEWANNFGDLYGTPKKFVQDTISKGKDVMLSIDVKGAMQVKRAYKDAALIFLLPPSMELLKRRLKKRRTEDRRTLTRRLKIAKKELTYLNKYNYVIINDKLPRAVKALKSIIIAERSRIKN